MQIVRIITILIIVASVPSCKDNGVGSAESRNPPIPFALGNRWTYVDSLLANTGLVVDTFTVIITSSRTDNFGTWWQFNRRFNPSITAIEFMASSDSIFSLQYAEGQTALVPIRSLEYLWPLGSEAMAYRSLYDGDAGIGKSISMSMKQLSIKAGTFSSALVIVYDIGRQLHRETIVPNVGMADLQITNNATSPIDQWWTRRRIQLLEYQVSQ